MASEATSDPKFTKLNPAWPRTLPNQLNDFPSQYNSRENGRLANCVLYSKCILHTDDVSSGMKYLVNNYESTCIYCYKIRLRNIYPYFSCWLNFGCLFVFVDLKHARNTREEEASIKKLPASDWPVGKSEPFS